MPRTLRLPGAIPERHAKNRSLVVAFVRISDMWGLSTEQQRVLLGNPSRSTYFKWRKDDDPPLPPDTQERISYILGIFKDLQILLPDAREADTWIKAPNANPLFGGKSALDRMLSGKVADLYTVRQYLDAERGGWA
jgi:antitoxin Xre/MbcA/ParS-like protein